MIKILVDIPPRPEPLAALERAGHYAIDCATPPGETARELDPARMREAKMSFCTFSPRAGEAARDVRGRGAVGLRSARSASA